MRIGIRLLLVLTVVLASAPALTGTLVISLNNDSTNDLYVTVYDSSTQPPLKVLVSALINGNGSITVSISPNSSGQGQLTWTATTVDSDMRTCGHGEGGSLNDGDTVGVTADSDCSGQ